jgi:hypothetical protein
MFITAHPAAAAAGTNVIAALVSNNNKSTDAGFDLDLQYLAPAANTQVPGQVSGVTIAPAPGPAGQTTIRIAWTKPQCDGSSFIQRYLIKATNMDNVQRIRNVGNPFVPKYSISVTGLLPCMDYQFDITAINAAGSSEPVTVVSSTTGCDR